VTQPTSNAQSSRFVPRRPQTTPPIYLIPTSSLPAAFPQPVTPSQSLLPTESSDEMGHKRANGAIDFASHSWDLATGGLKTLTAKRELPSLIEQRPTERLAESANVPRSYTFLLIVVACLLLMLVSGGVVLFVMLQP